MGVVLLLYFAFSSPLACPVRPERDAAAAAGKGCGAEHHASWLTSVNLAKRFAAETAVEPAEGVQVGQPNRL
jgi:hypothetical protein